MFWLSLAGAFLTVFFLLLGLLQLVFGPRREIMERLKESVAEETAATAPESVKSRGVFGLLGKLGRAVSRRPANLSKLEKKLMQARLYMRAEEFVGLSLFLSAALLLMFYRAAHSIPVALVAAFIGYRVPAMVLEWQRKKRLRNFENQLISILSTISSGLRAGYSFPQALEVVYKEMPPPASEEFGRVLRDYRLGRSMDEALGEAVERVESKELEMVVTAIAIQRQVGGNLAALLDKIEGTLQERINLREDIRALTAQQRFSAVIILLLPPVVAAVLLVANPEYILSLLREPMGLLALIMALVLQVIGIVIMNRISKIEV
jgi:tight adherence protein B